ncbi:MAG: multicopper oxidase domain-containing protein [Allomuricauda sp.]|uniref:Multicopper oxidase domain-containing protein n=1 Tax=Maribacter flavus TaxID=1658664 RepID=A0ABU7IN06_9FLAO|nr:MULTISPECIES: multicopper oxidase domain-containing protein [Flavobacteriaceae]MDC6407133.1 multicopper oxidase domain-containing protein [Maribacter sp. PR66]MEE1974264.1 multicopper oxidase domain-containing protein [Maribacter flavus]NDV17532.1 multicopper oxidase domain-containing protein [Muricauda sp. TY007]USD24602.1 multicopper oxidase domain-containing protein [Allomuricauda aquimarina]
MKTLNTILLLFLTSITFAQVGTNGEDRKEEGRNIKEYNLTIEENEITLAGVTANGMTINGGIPGPTLEFNEGDLAIINVTNKMDEETSVHWHGLILPNFYDGVPYLTTPPIKPNTTFQYRIPINQSGTYWYHSHTMLQEQKGVYGSIVIHPKEKTLDYDKDLVVVLSDWTNEKPMNVLRNLKRGNEWYQVKKGTAVPLSRVIKEGALGAQFNFWRDRMEGADIADIYYPAFLSNGKKLAEYPEFKTGEKVRLRFINASASSYYWVDFGGGNPMIVASDGVDVTPEYKNRFLFAIAETYDVIVTIPEGTLEITATAQDGSGSTSIHLGSGKLYPATVIDRPDKVAMMKQMAKMDMKMGAPALVGNKNRNTPEALMQKYGMKMNMDMKDGQMKMENEMNMEMKKDATPMNHKMSTMQKDTASFNYDTRKTYFNYDFLKAKENTTFKTDVPVNEILLNLTGNMQRYVWSMNGVPLSETDKIKIKSDEVTRITLNNLTMMHHPMHLHGHYFRVINENGERSPLKHTVNVPPMQKVVIEFYNEEYGDWFFHCHVLYHMMGGMARVFSYDTPRDERMKPYPVQNLIDETDHYYSWGMLRGGSNFNELLLMSSNIRNEFGLRAEFDYNQNAEIEVNYNRYLNDWVRVYAGVNTETSTPDSYDTFNTVGLVGVKYFTPYRFNVDVSIDHQLRPRIRLDRELLIFPRIFLEGEYEYRADFGWVNELENNKSYEGETQWLIGASYILSRNFSIQGNYNNRYGWGGGLLARF